MPSVITISGPEVEDEGLSGSKSKSRAKLDEDGCKKIRNKRTGCTMLLCPSEKSKSGWAFKKGSSSCPLKKANRR